MTQTVQTSPVTKLDLKILRDSGADPLSTVVTDYGTVYVTSITRDGCSGCDEQKPLFRELAVRLESQHGGRVAFSNLHIEYTDRKVRESEEAKRLLHHASYPTYMIHVKSQFGPLEHYRAAYPSMEELEKQIVSAFELSEFYANHAQRPA